jgi:hypothetical protein
MGGGMMTDKLRAAAQAALDAMSVVRVFVTSEEKIKHPEGTDWYDNIRINLDENIVNNIKEMNAIEAALAEPAIKESLTVQRPWVGLTDEEIDEIGKAVIGFNSLSGWENEFGLAIEAKLREKNT